MVCHKCAVSIRWASISFECSVAVGSVPGQVILEDSLYLRKYDTLLHLHQVFEGYYYFQG